MDDLLVKEMRAAQIKLNAEAENARNTKFRAKFEEIQKSAALGVDPEGAAQRLNKLLKEYDSLPEHIRT